ncbi:MAG: ice-binding family protein [Planctomycetota bacterium]
MNKFTKSVFGGIGVLLASSFIMACGNPLAISADPENTSSLGSARVLVMPDGAPILGMAQSFAVFGGGAGITNQGTLTAIAGDMGTTGASTMITGFHSADFSYSETPLNIGSVDGLVYTDAPQGSVEDFEIAKAVAADALTAFDYLASLPDGIDPGAGQLGGLTLIPGLYKSASGAFLLTGSDLTLDAQGDPDAIWVFQMASTLTVGTPLEARSIILVNGAQASNVYWQVGSAATINGSGGGIMAGTIIASSGMTFSTAGNASATLLNGRALSLFAAITMVNTVIAADGVSAVVPVEVPVEIPVEVPASPITISGDTATDVVAVVSGGGFIVVENNGGLVTVTETGTGTIDTVNNGGLMTATNTGNGLMTINSTATGTVTVTNTGNGRVTINASGADVITITHTGDEDFTYPAL